MPEVTVRDVNGVECIARGLMETEPWTEDIAEGIRAHLLKAGAIIRGE